MSQFNTEASQDKPRSDSVSLALLQSRSGNSGRLEEARIRFEVRSQQGRNKACRALERRFREQIGMGEMRKLEPTRLSIEKNSSPLVSLHNWLGACNLLD